MGGWRIKNYERKKKKKKYIKVEIEKINKFLLLLSYFWKAAVAPLPIYCLVYIASFLSKARYHRTSVQYFTNQVHSNETPVGLMCGVDAHGIWRFNPFLPFSRFSLGPFLH